MENKQTAVQWLIEELTDNGIQHLDLASEIIEQALQMERQQIEESFDEGNPNGFIDKDGKQYYTQTFNQ